MKMTNEEMSNYIDILSRLSEKGKLGYAIARNIRKLKDAAMEYLNLRAELFRKYGTQQGQTVTIPADNVSDYVEELGDIPQIEHDVDIFTVSEEEFCGGNLTSDQMSTLLWMVQEDKA